MDKAPVLTLQEEFRELINRRSMEGRAGNTHDTVVATFLIAAMDALGEAVKQRDILLGRLKPDGTPFTSHVEAMEARSTAAQIPLQENHAPRPWVFEATCEFFYQQRYQIRVWRSIKKVGDLANNKDIMDLRDASVRDGAAVDNFVVWLAKLPGISAVQHSDLDDTLKRGQVIYSEWP